MKILMISPEVAPLAKVGGLGDVVSALSKTLSNRGHVVRIVCPRYGFLERDETWIPYESPLYVKLGQGELYAKVWETHIPQSEVIVNFIEYNQYFHRHEIYCGPWGDHKDNNERFTFLSRSSLDLCYFLEWFPDVIHCNDWTTGLVPIYLNTTDSDRALGKVPTIFTIHNLAYQGIFGKGSFEFTGLPDSELCKNCLESKECINMLKGGLYNATKITTVSPSYAQEIQTPENGCGLDSLLKLRSDDLFGILNGVDYTQWNPKEDKLIPQNYSASNLAGKTVCKTEAQKKFNLKQTKNIPLFGCVSRLYEQKGLDILVNIIPKLLKNLDIQIIAMGSGNPNLEQSFQKLAQEFPEQMGVQIGFDNELSHIVEAGSDFFIMPSRFEPCGLNQMYSMIYGTLPIGHATGGLKDTIDDYTQNPKTATGFLFSELNECSLYESISKAYFLYTDNPKEVTKLQKNAMSKDFTWEKSAKRYEEVYEEAILECSKK